MVPLVGMQNSNLPMGVKIVLKRKWLKAAARRLHPISMTDETKLPTEIARLIQQQAVVSLGPWPRGLELFIFVSKAGWSYGLSPASRGSDLEYREGVLKIAREVQRKYPAGSVKGRPVG